MQIDVNFEIEGKCIQQSLQDTTLGVLFSHFLLSMTDMLAYSGLGVTIAAKNDYCDSIAIAESTIAILLLLWVTIAILLQYYCLK